MGGPALGVAFCTSHQADSNAEQMGKHSPLSRRGYAIRMVLLIVSDRYQIVRFLGVLAAPFAPHKMSSGSPP